MKHYLKYLIGALLFLYGQQSLWSQENSLVGLEIDDDAVLELVDVLDNELIVHTQDSLAMVQLGYDDDLTYFENAWTLTVNYEYTYTGATEIYNSGPKALTINYDPAGGETYVDRSSEIFLISDFEDEGLSKVVIDSYTLTSIDLTEIPAGVSLEVSHHLDRYYEIDVLDNPELTLENASDFGFTNPSNPESLELTWIPQDGAITYDLEWLFVEFEDCDPGIVDCPLLSEMEVNYTNATRIETKDNSYRIPALFGRGYVLYRVRAAGKNYRKLRVNGAWSPYLSSLSGATVTDANKVVAYKGFEREKNWVYEASFIENGKHKEVVSYYDGSQRNRQVVTVLNEDEHALISESLYDYQGRPVVNVLPYPSNDDNLFYHQNENFYGTEPYDRKHFDQDQHVGKEFVIGSGYVYTGAEKMSTTSGHGASNYYSTEGTHPVEGVNNEFIPSAEGYPYSRTVYSNDGLNRVLRTGGPGVFHEISTGRATEIVYTTINESAELDRLFGNEAGRNGYKKNYIEDSNGEITAHFYDLSDRLIASGVMLNQNEKPNLLTLDYKPDSASLVSALATGEYFVDGEIIGTSDIFSSHPVNPTLFSFDYSITETPFILLCGNDTLIDEPCLYDIEIHLYDEEWEPMSFSINQYDSEGDPLDDIVVSYIHEIGVGVDYSYQFEIDLLPGLYHIKKVLRLHEDIIPTYKSSYMDNLMASADCTPDTIPYPINDCDCNDTTSVDSIYKTVETEFSLCEWKYLSLLDDMSPGGQYFDNIVEEASGSYNPNAWLEAMDAKVVAYNLLNSTDENTLLENVNLYIGYTFADWDDLKCRLAEIEASSLGLDPPACTSGAGVFLFPEDWIEQSLLSYHPEYFQYIFNCGEIKIKTSTESGGNASGDLLYRSTDVLDYRDRTSALGQTAETTLISQGYFDPLNLVDNEVFPYVSSGSYNIPTGIEYFMVTDAIDEDIDLILSGKDRAVRNFDMDTYSDAGSYFTDAGIGSSTVYPAGDIFQPLYDYLTKFLVNEDYDGFYSIWDVMAYKSDQGILYDAFPNYTTSTTIPDHIKGLLKSLYDNNSGLLADSNPNQISRAKYFFNSYIFYREYLLYHKSEVLEEKFRVLYADVFDDFVTGTTDFDYRFSLGVTAVDSPYHLQPTNIAYTDVSTLEDVCYECPNPYSYSLHYPYMLPLDIYSTVDSIYAVLYADVENSSVTVNAATIAATMSAVEDAYEDGFPFDTTTLADSDCGQSCIFKADLWITGFMDCELSETGLDSLKTELVNLCGSSCDTLLGVVASSWTYSDVNNVEVTAEILASDLTTIVVNVVQESDTLCSNSILFYELETNQLDCGCNHLNEYIDIKDYNGDYSTMANDLFEGGLISDLSNYSGEWLNYCNTYDSLSVGDLDSLKTVGGGEFPAQWLNCDYIYVPSACELSIAACEYYLQLSINSIMDVNASLVGESNLNFENEYRAYCQENLNESFTVSSDLDEYSYTLYYYDQAGNIIKTVPPSGVDVLLQTDTLDSGVDINSVVAHRNNPFKTFVHPSHRMITNYKYNSLNGPTVQTTPDGGEQSFWYDALGRAILSQNAKQATMDTMRYSYVVYDALGRIVEAGEKKAPTGNVNKLNPNLTDTLLINKKVMALIAEENPSFTSENLDSIKVYVNDAQSILGLNGVVPSGIVIADSGEIDDLLMTLSFDEWMNPDTIEGDDTGVSKDRYEVVHSHYGEYAHYVIKGSFTVEYGSSGIDYSINAAGTGLDLRNHINHRIASVTYTEHSANGVVDYDYNNALHYSYDLHGNVKSMIQELHAIDMHRLYKKTDYTYDLVSGNVLKVAYQKNHSDQFFHQYHYDSDNRITAVETSIDGLNWDQDASYKYYTHGPQSRVEIGAKQVQGVDYVYNIHGWLKAVNGTRKDNSLDVGNDGYNHPLNGNRYTAKDAFGYSLNYYEGDYTSQADEFLMTFSGNDLGSYKNYKNLYNGNISQMITHISDLDIQAGQYTYDQNNRLKEMRVYKPTTDLLVDEPFAGQSAETAYHTSYKYDLNGNLMGMTRNDASGAAMDDFNYHYGGTLDANGENLPSENNKLYYVDDAIAASANNDMDDQENGNYQYDEIGQLLEDSLANIVNIEWTLQNKVKEIQYADTLQDIAFEYDPLGNRILKILKPKESDGSLKSQLEWIYTYYAHDVNGQLMGVYQHEYDEGLTDNAYVFKITSKGNPIYGIDRLGMHQTGLVETFNFSGDEIDGEIESNSYYSLSSTISNTFEREVGKRAYELKNHLGNVLVTISDRKVASGNTGLIDSYTSDVLSYSDYYPFGMEMPGRKANSSDYRFGFNGHEKDNEVKGSGNHISFGDYGYSPRLGRRWNIDPVEIVGLSGYATFKNNPNFWVDPDGESPISIFVKAVAKAGLKKAAKEGIEKMIKKRLKAYTKKKWAKQLGKDALDAIDLATSTAWWEYAIEFIPIAGDAYGAAKLGDQGYNVYKVVKKFESVGEWASKAAGQAWKRLGPNKLFGKGSDTVKQFSKKFNNQGAHLGESDLAGAVKEIYGLKSGFKPNGVPFQHLKEVQEALGGMQTQIKELKKQIKNGVFDGDALKAAQGILDDVTKQYNTISNTLNSAKKAAKNL